MESPEQPFVYIGSTVLESLDALCLKPYIQPTLKSSSRSSLAVTRLDSARLRLVVVRVPGQLHVGVLQGGVEKLGGGS